MSKRKGEELEPERACKLVKIGACPHLSLEQQEFVTLQLPHVLHVCEQGKSWIAGIWSHRKIRSLTIDLASHDPVDAIDNAKTNPVMERILRDVSLVTEEAVQARSLSDLMLDIWTHNHARLSALCIRSMVFEADPFLKLLCTSPVLHTLELKGCELEPKTTASILCWLNTPQSSRLQSLTLDVLPNDLYQRHPWLSFCRWLGKSRLVTLGLRWLSTSSVQHEYDGVDLLCQAIQFCTTLVDLTLDNLASVPYDTTKRVKKLGQTLASRRWLRVSLDRLASSPKTAYPLLWQSWKPAQVIQLSALSCPFPQLPAVSWLDGGLVMLRCTLHPTPTSDHQQAFWTYVEQLGASLGRLDIQVCEERFNYTEFIKLLFRLPRLEQVVLHFRDVLFSTSLVPGPVVPAIAEEARRREWETGLATNLIGCTTCMLQEKKVPKSTQLQRIVLQTRNSLDLPLSSRLRYSTQRMPLWVEIEPLNLTLEQMSKYTMAQRRFRRARIQDAMTLLFPLQCALYRAQRQTNHHMGRLWTRLAEPHAWEMRLFRVLLHFLVG